MTVNWNNALEHRKSLAAAALPPAMVRETCWDILLALYRDQGSELSVAKLGRIVSVSPRVLGDWLGGLEDRELVSGVTDRGSGQLRALLTPSGRALLDRYFSATSDLQVGTRN